MRHRKRFGSERENRHCYRLSSDESQEQEQDRHEHEFEENDEEKDNE